MSEVAVNLESEFPFMAGLPKREKTRLQKVMEHFREIKAISEKKGMLVPARLAARILDVSAARVNDLMKSGTLERVEVNEHPFVTEESLIEYAASERKAGRPSKLAQAAEKGYGPVVKEALKIGIGMTK